MATETLTTQRLLLRRPVATDAQAIFDRYASDPEVTRWLAWPRHSSLADTQTFLGFSDTEWDRWQVGPYLIELQSDGRLLGSTGLAFEAADVASTGYVLARDAWGLGYATEALRAMVQLAGELRLRRFYALCHPEHQASRHVLEKGGFQFEARLMNHFEFPNVQPGVRVDALCFAHPLNQPLVTSAPAT